MEFRSEALAHMEGTAYTQQNPEASGNGVITTALAPEAGIAAMQVKFPNVFIDLLGYVFR